MQKQTKRDDLLLRAAIRLNAALSHRCAKQLHGQTGRAGGRARPAPAQAHANPLKSH
jgi:hypothetical protein